MTIRNEYKQLKKENDIIFSTLAECDRDTITGIVNTINNTCGINYEVERVRTDLIAMAATAEAASAQRSVSAKSCRMRSRSRRPQYWAISTEPPLARPKPRMLRIMKG